MPIKTSSSSLLASQIIESVRNGQVLARLVPGHELVMIATPFSVIITEDAVIVNAVLTREQYKAEG